MALATKPFALLSVPTDVLREIFSYLQPGNLLRLCGVCRDFRIISLVVLFTTHRSHFQPAGEALSFSSSAVVELSASLRAIRKVTSRAKRASLDLAGILVALSRMLDLQELEVRFLPADDLNKKRLAQRLTESFVQRQRGYPSPVILMITKREIKISEERKRPPTWDWLFFVPRLRLPFPLTLALHTLRPPLTFLRNASIAEDQRARMFHDIGALRKPDGYTTMHLKALPSLSSVRTWNLLILDLANVRVLTVGHLISTRRWSLLLPQLNLPALEQLAICKDVVLPISELFAFCSHHPRIQLISFEHYSLSFDVQPADGESHFPSLDALEAPLHYFDRLLPFINATQLREVSIGKHPYNKVRGQRPRPARRVLHDRLEKRFDFDILDGVLDKLSQFSIRVLALVVPGGRNSKAWLRRCGGEGRIGPLLSQVETILVRSEFDVPFTPDVAALFSNLRALCPAMTKFRCRRVDAPHGVLPFPPSVAQEVGYVCAINDQPEVVDAFANIRCAGCGHYER